MTLASINTQSPGVRPPLFDADALVKGRPGGNGGVHGLRPGRPPTDPLAGALTSAGQGSDLDLADDDGDTAAKGPAPDGTGGPGAAPEGEQVAGLIDWIKGLFGINKVEDALGGNQPKKT